MQPEVKASGEHLAEVISDMIPPSHGFALLIFDMGEGGHISYISNARREDMLEAMAEFIGKHADG